MNVIIREANKSDVDSIVHIIYGQHGGDLEQIKKSIKDEILMDDFNFKTLVAIVEGEIVGRSKLFYFENSKHKVDYPSPDGWYLNGVIVLEKYRKKGIATKLYYEREKFIKDKALNCPIYSIVSDVNLISKKYHEKVGFKPFKEAEGFLNIKLECGKGILYRKDL